MYHSLKSVSARRGHGRTSAPARAGGAEAALHPNTAKLRLRSSPPRLVRQRRVQVATPCREVGALLHGKREMLDGLVDMALLGQHHAEIVVHLRIGGVDRERRAEMTDRLTVAPLANQFRGVGAV